MIAVPGHNLIARVVIYPILAFIGWQSYYAFGPTFDEWWKPVIKDQSYTSLDLVDGIARFDWTLTKTQDIHPKFITWQVRLPLSSIALPVLSRRCDTGALMLGYGPSVIVPGDKTVIHICAEIPERFRNIPGLIFQGEFAFPSNHGPWLLYERSPPMLVPRGT